MFLRAYVARVHKEDTLYVSLWVARRGATQDPETEVAKWLESGCPTGIGDSVITGCGVFPRAEGSSATAEASKIFARIREAQGWLFKRHCSCKSFYIGEGLTADAEVARLTRKGFVDVLPTLKAAEHRGPGATTGKVVLLLNEMVFQTREDWAGFSQFCCGVAAAPIPWCRDSAAGCRLA